MVSVIASNGYLNNPPLEFILIFLLLLIVPTVYSFFLLSENCFFNSSVVTTLPKSGLISTPLILALPSPEGILDNPDPDGFILFCFTTS